MSELLLQWAEYVSYLLIAYFLVLNGAYLIQGFLSIQLLQRYYRQLRVSDMKRFSKEEKLPPVALLIPAYNEETTIVDTLNNLQHLDYPDYELLVINDGSTDQTLDILERHFALKPAFHLNPNQLETETIKNVYRSETHPNIWVVDKENGGKSDALNAGLNYCQTPFFCVMDADTILEPYALTRMMFTFLTHRDTVAVGGILRILNGCTLENGQVSKVELPTSLLARLQVVEYMRSFLASRMSWNLTRGSLIISGAFGMFSQAAVINAGGFDTTTVGEDMELVVRLHRYCRENKHNYNIKFVPDPVAWTQCPDKIGDLYLQRERWQRGLVQSLMRHLPMLLNPRFGSVGLIGMPFFFFLEMLGPIIEVLGYAAFVLLLLADKVSYSYGVLFLGIAFGTGMVTTLVAIILSELNTRRFREPHSILKLLLIAFIENFGYRQLLSFWRFWGTFAAFSGSTHWGSIQRKSYQNAETSTQEKSA